MVGKFHYFWAIEKKPSIPRFRTNRTRLIGYGVAVLVTAMFLLYGSNSGNRQVAADELVVIKGMLAAPLEVSKETDFLWASIRLVQYDGKEFRLTHNSYAEFKLMGFERTIKEGDTVELHILKEDYDTEIAGTSQPGIIKQLTSHQRIRPYGVKAKNYTYLSLSDVNNANKADRMILMWIGIAIGALILAYGVLDFSGVLRKKK